MAIGTVRDDWGTDCATAEPTHDDERTDPMTDERDELTAERDRLAAELSELGDEIDTAQAEMDAIDDDLAAALERRQTTTEAFLPDEQVPASVSGETRDAIASHLGTLAEKRDVRSEEVAMANASKDVETRNAANAREDIEEIAAVIDRLEDRTDEAESTAQDARAELTDAKSRFADDLTALAARLARFDVTLYSETLGDVIDERIPERMSEKQEAIASASDRVAELSARASTLAADRDKLQALDGGGSCPTCDQYTGSERTETEVKAIETDLQEVERKLGAAKRERDESIAGKEELADLRDRAVALQSFRSETVAGAKGRVEDRQEAFEDEQADLDEERVGLAASREARDDADAAIETLESDIHGLEADIDRLQAKTDQGESGMQSFGHVDELRAQLEARTGALTELQAAYEELETERAAIDAAIEDLPDAE